MKIKPADYWSSLKRDDSELYHNYRLRESLVKSIVDEIREQELTQERAAALFDIPQSKISRLVNGHVEDFRIDRLVNFAFRVGINVTFSL